MHVVQDLQEAKKQVLNFFPECLNGSIFSALINCKISVNSKFSSGPPTQSGVTLNNVRALKLMRTLLNFVFNNKFFEKLYNSNELNAKLLSEY